MLVNVLVIIATVTIALVVLPLQEEKRHQRTIPLIFEQATHPVVRVLRAVPAVVNVAVYMLVVTFAAVAVSLVVLVLRERDRAVVRQSVLK